MAAAAIFKPQPVCAAATAFTSVAGLVFFLSLLVVVGGALYLFVRFAGYAIAHKKQRNVEGKAKVIDNLKWCLPK